MTEGGGGPVARSENVTILFTDLVGSTELTSQLAPEAADELRRGHFSTLRRAIAFTEGTEVKNLGDGLMVSFPAASAALSCSVAMQQLVEADNRSRGQALGLRVGLSCGEATRDGDDYFGDPVIEAARLCARAEGGVIVASDLIRGMAGRRCPHPLRPLGKLQLKGLTEPVDAVEVGWEPLVEPEATPLGIPLPSRLALTPTVGVIGRAGETAVLGQAFKRVSVGEGRQLVLISGEAGQGKTTVAAEAARDGFDEGACVLLGRCTEDLGAPYGPFVEALGHYVTHGPVELLRSHTETYGSVLARMIPALSKRLGELPEPQTTDADTERYLLFAAVNGLLGQVSALQPLILVLDDLQWADVPSLQILRHVVASAEPMRLLILGTYRDLELSDSHPLVDTLVAVRREPGVSRIELEGFDDVGVVSFMEEAAGHDLDDAGMALARSVYRETDGNPYFVGELLRHLAETGAIYRDATGHWTTVGDLQDVALPDSVRQVIGSRVGRLGEGARQVLSHASVIGRDFDIELLAEVSERNEDELLDILDMAAAVALVHDLAESPGHYSFSHTLIQHTLYQDLGSTRRARVHRKVAEALETLAGYRPGKRVAELARHWSRTAQPGDFAKATSYARQAADAALAALAPDDAVRYFSQALQLSAHLKDPDPVLHIDLLTGLGSAQRQSDNPGHRETLLEAARRARDLGDADRLAVAALANNAGRFSATIEVDPERLEVLESALALLSNEHSVVRAELQATLAVELSWSTEWNRRRALAEESVTLARRLEDRPALVRVIARAFHALYAAQTHTLRRGYVDEALEITDEMSDPGLRGLAVDRAMWWLLDEGDLERFDLLMAEQQSLVDRLGEPELRLDLAILQAIRSTIGTSIDEAQRAIDGFLELDNLGGRAEITATVGTLAGVLAVRRGDLADYLQLIELGIQTYPGLPAARASLASLYCELGRYADARSLLDAAVYDGLTRLSPDRLWLLTLSMWGDTAAELGDRESSDVLYKEIKGFEDQVLTPAGGTAEGPVAYHLGRLASALDRYDEAARQFLRADDVSRRLGEQFWVARNNLAYARMLRVRGEPDDSQRADRMSREALSIAGRQGYQQLAREARKQLSVGT